MKRVSRLLLLSIALVLSANAADWTEPTTQYAWAGENVGIPLQLKSTDPVVGLSGHLVYDPTVFTSPGIVPSKMQPANIIAVGHLIDSGESFDGAMREPARFRFSVYANPLVTLVSGQPIAYVQLFVIGTESMETQLTYSDNLAGNANLVSYGNVDLAPATIVLNTNSVSGWTLFE